MYRYTIATFYILYGIVKIILALSLFVTQMQKLPGFRLLKDSYSDKTVAGRFYEFILVALGIYTIAYGLSILRILPNSITNIIEYRHTENIIFLLFGTMMVIFYSLVLYTNLPISKDPNHIKNYKLLGFWGGILFLITPFVIEGVLYSYPIFRTLNNEEKTTWVLGIILLLAVVADIGFKIYKSAQ